MMWRPGADHGRKRETGDEAAAPRGLTPDGPLRKHYSCVLVRSPVWCAGTVRRSRVAGVAVEDALELWAGSLREVKRRIRPLFTQERVAVSAGVFLGGVPRPPGGQNGGGGGRGGGRPRPPRAQGGARRR